MIQVLGRTTGYVKKITLSRDIKNGITVLEEKSYSDMYGTTKASLLFYLELKKHINMDNIYSAHFRQSENGNYNVILYSKDGYTIMFNGLSFGYYGEGSRGSMDILKDIGFTAEKVEQVATKQSNFTLYREVK